MFQSREQEQGVGVTLVVFMITALYGHVTAGASHLMHSCLMSMTAERARFTKWISSIPRPCFMVSASLREENTAHTNNKLVHCLGPATGAR